MGARVVVLFVGTEYVPDLMQQTAERMQSISRRQHKNHPQSEFSSSTDYEPQKKIIW